MAEASTTSALVELNDSKLDEIKEQVRRALIFSNTNRIKRYFLLHPLADHNQKKMESLDLVLQVLFMMHVCVYMMDPIQSLHFGKFFMWKYLHF
jgi:uncharacterized membrane protein